MAFLAFEGIDGSGKSTLLELLADHLKSKGISVVTTKEPGGTPIGKKIRNILLEKENSKLNPISESLLYYADRKQHIEELLSVHLKDKSKWILSDRYWASTSAYQCGGRELDETFINSLRQLVCSGYEPDLWVLLDASTKLTEKRLLSSGEDSRDRMEMEGRLFQKKVRDYYLKLAGKNPEKWLVLSAEKPSFVLLQELLSHLKEKNFLI